MIVLGISCFYHDSAVAIIKDGEVIAAAQEERFTRVKQTPDFPSDALRSCLETVGLTPDDVDFIGFYEKPLVKFFRIIETFFTVWPKGLSSFVNYMPAWLTNKFFMQDVIRKEMKKANREMTGRRRMRREAPIYFIRHHLAHAASSFLVSPFEEAAILTVDGVGEWSTATRGVGRGSKIELTDTIRYPHSLGLLYSAFTYYLGFKINSGEYKVMGLAPYGEPKYAQAIRDNLIDIKEDGSFELNMDYFTFPHGSRMIDEEKFTRLFDDLPVRGAEDHIEDERYFHIAASVQAVTEEVMLKLASDLFNRTKMDNLVMAGGVALNCVANGHILRRVPFKNIFIVPAAGDAGGALGVAAYVYHSIKGRPRETPFRNPFLGPEFSREEVKAYLDDRGAPYEELPDKELFKRTAEVINSENVVGWFQGRMEYGPRALGNRTILADPRVEKMRDIVNVKIKFREGFRPFAPSILYEHTGEWFGLDRESPYMLLVDYVNEGKRVVPAITHVDNSVRIQTVKREDNERYYDVISAFKDLTGCPLVLNTSFNIRGEPIVCTPHDAFICFMRTNMDYLVLGNFILDKKKQEPLPDYEVPEFKLD